MNTTNTPDRDEVITAVKEILTWYPPHQEYPRYALSSALTLLEQDREDGKRLDWLEHQEGIGIGDKGYGEYEHYAGDTNFPPLRQVVDSAMAATTEKGEG
jgi:hypothetical protein